MEHLAILSKKKKLLEKIISGSKTIESRWYKSKKAPFNTLSEGDLIYFKESGDKVIAKAVADKIIIFNELTPEKIKDIILEYGDRIGIDLSYAKEINDKKMCMLVFLKNVEKIEPFEINKSGFGIMSAWISVESIPKIKKIDIPSQIN